MIIRNDVMYIKRICSKYALIIVGQSQKMIFHFSVKKTKQRERINLINQSGRKKNYKIFLNKTQIYFVTNDNDQNQLYRTKINSCVFSSQRYLCLLTLSIYFDFGEGVIRYDKIQVSICFV